MRKAQPKASGQKEFAATPTILIVPEYLFPFYSSDNDVMKRSGSVYAGLARHKCIILLCARSQFVILWASFSQVY